jgi:hypothetical protein
MSTATTRSQWRAAQMAWTPDPVPTSNADRTFSREVRVARIADGAVTVAT